jgi:hypothetical protein
MEDPDVINRHVKYRYNIAKSKFLEQSEDKITHIIDKYCAIFRE